MNLKTAKQVAEAAALQAGKFILQNQNKVKVKAYKDRQDIVTNIDLAVEQLIIDRLSKSFPDHNIYSEEKGIINHGSEYTWVIDPLDGTKEYSRGLPIFNVNISLENSQEILLGVVYLPKIDELFVSLKGQGAKENGQPIQVSQETQLENCFIYTHLPTYKRQGIKKEVVWQQLEKITASAYRLRTFQADVISLCWLAKGAVDGVVFLLEDEHWWDMAAGLLMVEEAGGRVTDLDGRPIKHRNLNRGIIASNAKIHDQLISLLKG